MDTQQIEEEGRPLADDTQAMNMNEEDLNNDIHKLAQLYAKQNGFEQYLQTSSMLGTNVKNVFDIAIQRTLDHRKDKLAAQNVQEGATRSKSEEEIRKKRKCIIF